MTQKSKGQRERRRRRWYDEERPVLLVRLRLVASPGVVNEFKDTTWTKRDQLRRAVHYCESRNQPTERK